MKGFETQLGPRRLGAEVLVQIAQHRASGRLLWSTSGVQVQLTFRDGRAEQAMYGAGQQMTERDPVVGVLRGFATTMEGGCTFEPAADVEARLRIDTLGEVLVALHSGLRRRQLEQIWDARAGDQVAPSETFDRIAQALQSLGSPALKRPLPDSTVGTVTAGADEATQRCWVALIALGALRVTPVQTTKTTPRPAERPASASAPPSESSSPPGPATSTKPPAREEPLPDDPELRALAVEVLEAHGGGVERTHYDILGVAAGASVDTIRKAYFEQAKRWHSDRFAGTDLPESIVDKAADLFRSAEEAHRVLSDADERKSYDYVLDRKAKGLPTDPKVIFEADNLFRRAETLVRRGQADAAEPLLREAVALNKGEAAFWVYLGWAVYNAQGSKGFKEAREHIETGLAMREKNDVAHEFLGRMYHAEGRLKEAERELKLAVEQNRKNVEAQRELRLLQMRKDKAKTHKESKGLGGLLEKVLKR